MRTETTPAIHRLIEHVGSAAELARQLGVPPQHVLAWKSRGWASPLHVLAMEMLVPEGISLRDLLDDRRIAQEREAAEALAKERAAKRANKAA
jgi:DNA-binding transcriptional regulator YdaS (Cro superfamily)